MDEREALIQEYERLHKEADRLFQQWLALICPGIDVEALRQTPEWDAALSAQQAANSFYEKFIFNS